MWRSSCTCLSCGNTQHTPVQNGILAHTLYVVRIPSQVSRFTTHKSRGIQSRGGTLEVEGGHLSREGLESKVPLGCRVVEIELHCHAHRQPIALVQPCFRHQGLFRHKGLFRHQGLFRHKGLFSHKGLFGHKGLFSPKGLFSHEGCSRGRGRASSSYPSATHRPRPALLRP